MIALHYENMLRDDGEEGTAMRARLDTEASECGE